MRAASRSVRGLQRVVHGLQLAPLGRAELGGHCRVTLVEVPGRHLVRQGLQRAQLSPHPRAQPHMTEQAHRQRGQHGAQRHFGAGLVALVAGLCGVQHAAIGTQGQAIQVPVGHLAKPGAGRGVPGLGRGPRRAQQQRAVAAHHLPGKALDGRFRSGLDHRGRQRVGLGLQGQHGEQFGRGLQRVVQQLIHFVRSRQPHGRADRRTPQQRPDGQRVGQARADGRHLARGARAVWTHGVSAPVSVTR